MRRDRARSRADRRDWPADSVREWAGFVVRGWRDGSVPVPASPWPASALARLGLAPLAYRALSLRLDARAVLVERAYRQAAAHNLVTMAAVARARDLLEARGIVPVLIKGGAFLLRHAPGDAGVRAMADFDLLVDPARFDEAFNALLAAGWQRLSPERRHSSRVAPATTLVATDPRDGDAQLDLHRHLAQWPLLRRYPPEVLARTVERGGWRVPALTDTVLITAAHRARHAFAGDARDLVDLWCALADLDDAQWTRVLGDARRLGLVGALDGALRQAAWWFGEDVPGAATGIAARARETAATLGPVRRQLIARLADPRFVLTGRSPWSGPLGRNLVVFPGAFHDLPGALAAAVVYLPTRVFEWRPPT